MNIPKVRSTHVSDNKVVDDGYNLADVENAIKVIPMQNYLGSTETDVTKLFQMLVDDADGKKPVKEVITEPAIPLTPVKAVIKKRGRPAVKEVKKKRA